MTKPRPVRTAGGIVRWPPSPVPPPPPPPPVPPAKQGSTPPVTCKREHNRWKRRPDGRRYCMSCQALSTWRHRGGPPLQPTFTKDGHSLRELVKEWEREKEGGEGR